MYYTPYTKKKLFYSSKLSLWVLKRIISRWKRFLIVNIHQIWFAIMWCKITWRFHPWHSFSRNMLNLGCFDKFWFKSHFGDPTYLWNIFHTNHWICLVKALLLNTHKSIFEWWFFDQKNGNIGKNSKILSPTS